MDKLVQFEDFKVEHHQDGFEVTVVMPPATDDFLQPDYFVKHPDESYTIADPQPYASHNIPHEVTVRLSVEQAQQLANAISHKLVTR